MDEAFINALGPTVQFGADTVKTAATTAGMADKISGKVSAQDALSTAGNPAAAIAVLTKAASEVPAKERADAINQVIDYLNKQFVPNVMGISPAIAREAKSQVNEALLPKYDPEKHINVNPGLLYAPLFFLRVLGVSDNEVRWSPEHGFYSPTTTRRREEIDYNFQKKQRRAS
jgi:hypothetical protein